MIQCSGMDMLSGIRRRFSSGLFTEFLSRFLPWGGNDGGISGLLWPPFDAVQELKKRQQDPMLRKKVEEYLHGDIPEYFQDGPVLYLARHIATPNFETLRFKHLMEPLGMKTVVGQDSKDFFVSSNQAKRALCKLSICRGVSQKDGILNERFENISIIDFNSADGKRFDDIMTLWGEKLIGFHARLFSKFMSGKIKNPDDAEWIDRHHRGDLFAHYKKFLALFITHGILFEDYVMEDKHEIHFVKHVLRPACRFIEQYFGYRPLIVPLVPKTFESSRFWTSYPEEVLRVIHDSMPTRQS